MVWCLNKILKLYAFLANPDEAKGWFTNNTSVIDSLTTWLTHPFPHTALWRHHSQTVGNSSSSYKVDCFVLVKKFLNPKGYQSCIIDSKVKAILLPNGGILPIGGVASGRVCEWYISNQGFLPHQSFHQQSMTAWYKDMHGSVFAVGAVGDSTMQSFIVTGAGVAMNTLWWVETIVFGDALH